MPFLDPQRQSAFGWRLATDAETFSNTTGTQTLFTVTGDVIVKVIAVCTTNCASAGACNVEVGIAGSTGTIIATTDVTLLADREIWHDATPDSEIEALSVMSETIISDSNNIILTLSAQIDSGAISFYCMWTPLSYDGNVI